MNVALKKLASVEDFYAHAIGLEHEFEDRLTDLASCLKAHNNPESSKVFLRARSIHAERITRLDSLAVGLQLPAVAPWDYVWHYSVNLEIICITSVHYLMTPLEALEMVQEKLNMAREFYRSVCDRYKGNAVGEAAELVLHEIDNEIREFRRWHQDLERIVVPEDHDPPNEPH